MPLNFQNPMSDVKRTNDFKQLPGTSKSWSQKKVGVTFDSLTDYIFF